MNYKHILFVTDLNEDSCFVAEKVKNIIEINDAKLSVIHVVLDNIIAGGYEIMPLFNYTDDKENLKENAQALKSFLKESKIKPDSSDIVSALSTAGGISDYADENGVDLIIVGAHKKTGLLNNLLGNTSTALLKNANCDVLSVLIPESSY